MIGISEALKGVTRLGLDTAPIIYYIEEHPLYLPRVAPIFAAIADSVLVGVTSAISVAEVLVQPLRQNAFILQQEYLDLLVNSANFEIQSIDAQVAQTAASLRARFAIRLPDALQIAAAVHADCSVFLTNDRQLSRVNDLSVLILDDLEV